MFWREERRAKKQGESSWSIFACEDRGWEMHSLLEGKKSRRSLQEFNDSVGVPGHTWLRSSSPDIWALIHSIYKVDIGFSPYKVWQWKLHCYMSRNTVYISYRPYQRKEWSTFSLLLWGWVTFCYTYSILALINWIDYIIIDILCVPKGVCIFFFII